MTTFQAVYSALSYLKEEAPTLLPSFSLDEKKQLQLTLCNPAAEDPKLRFYVMTFDDQDDFQQNSFILMRRLLTEARTYFEIEA